MNESEKSDKQEGKEPVIGTLNEHTLHLALKNYFEPDPAFHEQKYKGFVADVKRGEEIIEIETRSFSNVKRKLEAFLSDCRVTVVYPVAEEKWIVLLNPVTGEVGPKRKSPKKGRPCDVFYEMYKLRPFLKNENLAFRLVKMQLVEYKRKEPGRRGRKSTVREERIPVGISGTLDIRCPKDYEKLVDSIPEGEFTAAQFAGANKMKPRYAWSALQVLLTVGVLAPAGKRGRALLYRRSEQTV